MVVGETHHFRKPPYVPPSWRVTSNYTNQPFAPPHENFLWIQDTSKRLCTRKSCWYASCKLLQSLGSSTPARMCSGDFCVRGFFRGSDLFSGQCLNDRMFKKTHMGRTTTHPNSLWNLPESNRFLRAWTRWWLEKHIDIIAFLVF